MDIIPEKGKVFLAVPNAPKSDTRYTKLRKALGWCDSGMERAAVVGTVNLFHAWGKDLKLPDGCLRDHDAEDLAIACEFDEDPDVFQAALLKAGFIEERDGCLWIADFKEYGGREIESRKREAERKATQRKGTSASPSPDRPTKRDMPSLGHPGMSANVPGTSGDNQGQVGDVPGLEKNDVNVVRQQDSLRETVDTHDVAREDAAQKEALKRHERFTELYPVGHGAELPAARTAFLAQSDEDQELALHVLPAWLESERWTKTDPAILGAERWLRERRFAGAAPPPPAVQCSASSRAADRWGVGEEPPRPDPEAAAERERQRKQHLLAARGGMTPGEHHADYLRRRPEARTHGAAEPLTLPTSLATFIPAPAPALQDVESVGALA